MRKISGKKGAESLVSNKLIILILVVLVIALIIWAIIRFDVFDWFKNLPDFFKKEEAKDINTLTDSQQRILCGGAELIGYIEKTKSKNTKISFRQFYISLKQEGKFEQTDLYVKEDFSEIIIDRSGDDLSIGKIKNKVINLFSNFEVLLSGVQSEFDYSLYPLVKEIDGSLIKDKKYICKSEEKEVPEEKPCIKIAIKLENDEIFFCRDELCNERVSSAELGYGRPLKIQDNKVILDLRFDRQIGQVDSGIIKINEDILSGTGELYNEISVYLPPKQYLEKLDSAFFQTQSLICKVSEEVKEEGQETD